MRLPVALVSVAVWVGCYDPSAATGVPCAENATCPAGQRCDTSRTPPVCSPMADEPDAGAGIDVPAVSCTDELGCPTDLPVCDPTSHTCRRCAADAECASDVCHELAGRCVPEAEVLYVSATGTLNPNCTRTEPCQQIEAALAMATTARATIKVADGVYDPFEIRSAGAPVMISGSDLVAAGASIDAANGSRRVEIIDAQTVAVLEGVTIDNAGNEGFVTHGTLTLSHVDIVSSNRTGLDVRGGTTRVLDCRIVQGMQEGVRVMNGTFEMTRTLVLNNRTGGVQLSGGTSSITHSIIARNGGFLTTIGGVRISNQTTPPTFRFNTIAYNTNTVASGGGVTCDQAAMLDSSIFAGNGIASTQISTDCSASYSLFSTAVPATATNSKMGDPLFVDVQSDFHITAGSPAIDAADPVATDGDDIDRQPRPQGAARDMGADELP